MTSSHQVDVLELRLRLERRRQYTLDFPRFFTSPLEGPFPLFSRCRDSYTPELTHAFPRYSELLGGCGLIWLAGALDR